MDLSLKRRTLLVNGTLVVLLAGGAGIAYFSLADNGAGASQTRERLTTVARGTVEATVSASGSVASTQQKSLDFGTSGTVRHLYARAGHKVAKGDELARLDQTDALETLQAARLTLNAAATTLSKASTDTASAQYAKAYSAWVQAKQSYRAAEDRLSATVLKAPFSGTVTEVNGSVGDTVSGGSSSSGGTSGGTSGGGSGGSGGSSGGSGGSGGSGSSGSGGSGGSSGSSSGFVTLIDTRSLEVVADFTEADSAKLKVGQDVTVGFDALTGKTASGTIAQIATTPTTSNNVVTFAVTAALDDVPSGVRIGQTSTVEVTTGSADNALYVPSAAVRTVNGVSTVTVMENGRQVPRTVKTGLRGNQGTVITSGLREGDQVVVVSAAPASGTGGRQGGFPGGGAPGGFPGGGGGFGGGSGGGGRR
ncbi:efflux RND transporter periplasmic adaptor subunit [Actinomadura harenae]|uniref:HlyD family efflux transporter periplasmic adaptor subunit n=1 Tax=Actinomadura harenae TaxID=2483351 RepID=A0A3M2M3F0_9ACTN|nr:HlyD family efflux transporter periplasmic adaptor subunit [Actinomadura harenae]RMI43640.1 HlyD family efflux transporter periplasmic adaptor subunit [Actinomadura harenae]